MSAQVIVIAGPAAAGKTAQLLSRYRQELGRGGVGTALWLAPHQRSVFDVRSRLLNKQLDACFTPGVTTFGWFADGVLNAAPTPIQPLGSVAKRRLIHRLIDEARAAGRLKHFAPIAATTGLVDLIDAWISELKRLEIWPEDFRRACLERGTGDKDRELIDLYERYQQALTSHNLFDAEGRFWSARALLRGGQTRPWDHLRLVVADGFTDFTRTQHEILQILAERVAELRISLPLEAERGREDLFAKCTATLEQLRRYHPRLELRELPRPKSSTDGLPQGLAHLERELFKSPREVKQAEDAGGLEILAAPRQYGEVQLVGKQIKELLTTGQPSSPTRERGEALGRLSLAHASGLNATGEPQTAVQPVRPGEIAVVFRSLPTVAPLVREVFSELGIPFALEAGRPLDDSPALAAMLALLRLAHEDWPFRRVLAVIGSSYFQPAWPEWNSGRAAASVEWAVRELQIPSGRKGLLERLRRRAAPAEIGEATAEDESALRDAIRRERAQVALPVLLQLDAALARLPQRATAGEWASALVELAEATGFLAAIKQRGERAASESNDRAAWDRLQLGLLEADELNRSLADASQADPDKLDLAACLELVLDILRCEQLPGDHDETGRVRVLSAYSARALSIPYLFFAGLSEKAMPAPEREDRLYSDGEYHELQKQGLPLVLRSQQQQDEMLLFYEIVTRATRYLQLSYPALDEKAQPLLASPYVLETERAFAAGKVARRVVSDLSPIPQNEQPLCPTDFRLQAVAQALAGKPELLSGLLQAPTDEAMVRNLGDALHVVAERAHRDRFGTHEGLFESDAARAVLDAKYSPEHCWSASELEKYASCPFLFFGEKILNLSPLPEIALETNYLRRGRMLHSVLSGLHKKLGKSPGRLAAADFDKALTEMLGLLVSLEESDPTLANALREVDRRTLADWLRNYQKQHRAYEEQWRDCDEPLQPAHYEVSFGSKFRPGDVEHDARSVEEPLVLDCHGESLRFQGRIDRIDVGKLAGRTVFNVLDYKSGKAGKHRKDQDFDGTALQLEIYALAVEKLLLADQEALPLAGGYWFVQKRGFETWVQLHEEAGDGLRPTEDWSAAFDLLSSTLAALVRGIRAGQFPVFSRDEKCTNYCPLATICRVNQIRSLEKTWDPKQCRL